MSVKKMFGSVILCISRNSKNKNLQDIYIYPSDLISMKCLFLLFTTFLGQVYINQYEYSYMTEELFKNEYIVVIIKVQC